MSALLTSQRVSDGLWQIEGYDVTRVRDGAEIAWEVIHPEKGLMATVATLFMARDWIRTAVGKARVKASPPATPPASVDTLPALALTRVHLVTEYSSAIVQTACGLKLSPPELGATDTVSVVKQPAPPTTCPACRRIEENH